jgi:Protein of unknown function (DUF1460)
VAAWDAGISARCGSGNGAIVALTVRAVKPFLFSIALLLVAARLHAELPFDTVFKGREKFDAIVAQAAAWKQYPIGTRTALVGRALAGTPYKGFTLEIHDHIEAPSVNLHGLDCWTFFEISLAFARMLDAPQEQWTPSTLLRYIELDRYRGGQCDGTYLSRLHYLEEWLHDNDRRGLVADLTRTLGGERTSSSTGEMTINWRTYRYMRANPALRPMIRAMEERVATMPMYHIPKSRVPSIEPSLRSGDVIGITTHDPGGTGTSHVGIAYRTPDGVLRFMHASAPRNHGRVVLDARLSDYLNRFRTHAGIIVARPLR